MRSDDLMRRHPPTLLFQFVPRILAVAIVLILGLQRGPRPLVNHPSAPVVCSIVENVPGDALKVGQRVEPRVFPASCLDRLPAVPRPLGPGAVAQIDNLRLGNLEADGRCDGDRPPIVQHIPRMERGDPPRI